MVAMPSALVSIKADEDLALRKIETMLNSGKLASSTATAVLPKLVGPNGETVEVPLSALRILQQAMACIGSKKALSVASYNQVLDIQQAADLLNTSKTFLIKLLDQGDLACIEMGTQRFVPLNDLLTYKKRVSQERRQALAEMAQISQEVEE